MGAQNVHKKQQRWWWWWGVTEGNETPHVHQDEGVGKVAKVQQKEVILGLPIVDEPQEEQGKEFDGVAERRGEE